MAGYKTYILCAIGVIILGLRAAGETGYIPLLANVPPAVWEMLLGWVGFGTAAAIRDGLKNAENKLEVTPWKE